MRCVIFARRQRPTFIKIIVVILVLLFFGCLVQWTNQWQHAVVTTEETVHSKPTYRHLQRLVLLPGPHKTGSTSVQSALLQWMQQAHSPHEDKKRPINTFVSTTNWNDWAWPAPTRQELVFFQQNKTFSNDHAPNISYPTNQSSAKDFQPLFAKLLLSPTDPTIKSSRQPSILPLYRTKLETAMQQGRHILIASETLDRLVSTTQLCDDNSNNKAPQEAILWQRLFSFLPPQLPFLVVGIVHRTPRIDHVRSIWRHLGKTKNHSLAHFVLTKLDKYAHNLDSMGLAAAFASAVPKQQQFVAGSRPANVIVVNPQGAREQGMDLPVAMACHVLQVEDACTLPTNTVDSQQMTTKTNSSSMWQNHRSDPGPLGISQKLLDKLEDMLRDYDCQYQYLFDSASAGTTGDTAIQMVYPGDVWDHCKPRKRRPSMIPLSDVVAQMQELVRCEVHCVGGTRCNCS